MSVDVTWDTYKGFLVKARYGNHRIALIIAEPPFPSGEVIGIASVNIPDEDMADDEVAIKTYSENVGVIEALKPTGILKEKVRDVQKGYVVIPIYKIDLDVLEKCDEFK